MYLASDKYKLSKVSFGVFILFFFQVFILFHFFPHLGGGKKEYFYLFIYFWQFWVAMHGLFSSCGEQGLPSS